MTGEGFYVMFSGYGYQHVAQMGTFKLYMSNLGAALPFSISGMNPAFLFP